MRSVTLLVVTLLFFPLACGDATEVADTVDTTSPGDTDTSVPDDTDTTSPGDTDTSVPDDTDTTSPGDTDTSVPDDTDTSVPDDTDTTTPGDTDTSVPDDTDTTSPGDTDTSVPDDTDVDTTTPNDTDVDTTTPNDTDVDTTTPDTVVVPNTPPSITVTLADTQSGDLFVCDATASDADGDTLTLSYAWRHTSTSGSVDLSETSATLRNVFASGDQVTCTVTADDGRDTRSATGLATSRDRDLIAYDTSPRLTFTSSSAGPDDASGPDASDTLHCELVGVVDPDDLAPVALHYTWEVNGLFVATETRTSGSTSLTGEFAKFDTVRCLVTTDAPTPLTSEASVVIANHVPTCDDLRATHASGAPSCRCDNVVDADLDSLTPTCAWTDFFGAAPVATGCAPTGDFGGRNLRCTLTVADAEGASSSGEVGVFVTGATSETITWNNPGVTLTPSTLSTSDLDVPLTCSWNATASNTAGKPINYFVLWRRDDTLGVAAGLGSYGSTTTLRELGAVTTGSQVSCIVLPSTAGYNEDGVSGESARLTVTLGAPSLSSLTPSHTSDIAAGETFSCRAEVHANTAGGSLAVSIQHSDDGLAWSELTTTTNNAQAATALTVVDPDTRPWLRCSASTAGVLRETSDPVRALVALPELAAARIVPTVSGPCDARELVVWVRDPDAVDGYSTSVVVSVVWSVDGIAVGTDQTTFTPSTPGAGFDAVYVPMLAAGASNGSRIDAAVSVTKTGLGPVEADATSYVSGSGPTVTGVSLPESARVGETLTCGATMTGSCGEGTELAYTWSIDGVLSDVTTATFDTRTLDGAQRLSCAARAGREGIGWAGATASNTTLMLPSAWRIEGAEVNDHAGLSLAVIGDIDGDGVAELAVGAPNAAPDARTSAGKLYLLGGGDAGGVTSLAEVESGASANTSTGVNVVIRGDSGGWQPFDSICRRSDPTYQLTCAPSAAGWDSEESSEGPLGDGLGTRVIAPGDLDGDGIVDLIVSAPYALASGQYLAGRTYLVSGAILGAATADTIDGLTRAGLGATFEGEQGVWPSRIWSLSGANNDWDGHNAGFGLASGDYDGDGVPDLAIGAPFVDSNGTNSGRVYQIPLMPTLGFESLGGSLATMPNADDPSATGLVPGRLLDGKSNASFLWGEVGGHLSSLGDFDGDGYDDLLVADTAWHENLYLVLGSATFAAQTDEATTRVALSETTRADVRALRAFDFGIDITGTTVSPLGNITRGRTELFAQPAGVGDVNGDGLADLAVPFVEYETQGQLELAVFFGHSGTGDIDISAPDRGAGGFVVEGRPRGREIVGIQKAYAIGDVDGDGLDDIGLAIYSLGNVYSAYIIYGRTSTSTLTFAELEAGTGGLLLDMPDQVTALAGGDLDGDGLSDLIIGMAAANEGRGVVEVWYGRERDSDTSTVGTVGDDRIAASAGVAVLYAGAGDDTLVIDSVFSRVDGGTGQDTLELSGSLVLAEQRGKIRSIERVTLQSGARLDLTARDLMRLSEKSNSLIVSGSGLVRVTDTGWRQAGTATTYTNGNATLVLEGPDAQFAPELLTTSLEVSEGASANTQIGTLEVLDLDGDSVQITVATTDGLSFASGALSVATAGVLDHETRPTVTLAVTLTGADGLTSTTTLTLTVLDANEAPALDVLTSPTLAEGSLNNSLVAVTRAIDPDAGDAVSYTITGEVHTKAGVSACAACRAFAIDAATGRITVSDSGWLDYETADQIVIGLRATDRAGLSDDAQMTVTVGDRTSLPQVFTLPFLTESQSVWGPGPSLSLEVETSEAFDTLDLDIDTETGDVQAWSPIADTPITFDMQQSGEVGVGLTGAFTDGYISAYMPLNVTLEFPDDIQVGVPFTITSDWELDDSGALWGQTMSYDFDLQMQILDAAFSVIPDGLDEFMSARGPLDFTNGTLSFDMDAQDIIGAKYDVLYPQGESSATDCDISGGWSALGDLLDSNKQFCALRSALVWVAYRGVTYDYDGGFDLYDPDDAFAVEVPDDFVAPDTLLAPITESTAFEVPLSLESFKEIFGASFANLWAGTIQMPFGNFGYFYMRYVMWQAWFWLRAKSYETHSVTIERVEATVTFEDGSSITAELRDGFPQITLPASADVNGDGRVAMTIRVIPTAHIQKIWIYGLSLEWDSELGSARYSTFIYNRDLTGTITGTTEYNAASFGPLRTSTTNIGGVGTTKLMEWDLEGITPIEATGTLQLSRQ